VLIIDRERGTKLKFKKLLKGNHAIVEGAINAGCRYFFGYPITPQSELMEWMANRMPEVGGVFLQAESEVSAINMVIGAAVSGGRVMTASSGPGMDLFQEGIGNLHAHQLPCVIVDIMRGGPGNGALHPSQQDYNQAIRGGRGDQKNIVLAPWNAQEMYDLTILAFELADKYRNIAMILADSVLGQVYETLEIEDAVKIDHIDKEWALKGAQRKERKLSIAHFPDFEVYNNLHHSLQEKYKLIASNEQRCELYFIDEKVELIVVAYGIVARNAYAAVRKLREKGFPVGLFRPISLFPFPTKELNKVTKHGAKLMSVEISAGQMAEDIKCNINLSNILIKPGQATAEVPKSYEIEKWILEQFQNTL